MAGEVDEKKNHSAYSLLTLLFDINSLVHFVSTRWQQLARCLKPKKNRFNLKTIFNSRLAAKSSVKDARKIKSS